MAVAAATAPTGSLMAASQKIEVDPKLKSHAIGEGKAESSDEKYAAALKAMITDFEFENNRRYHAYKAGSYAYPNDDMEKDRLDIVHKMTEVVLEGKIHLAPVSRSVKRILDIGTGTGIWAMDMGDRYPNAEILGNDLSPIQPQWTPPNVHFEIDDVEASWNYAHSFDFIHCRYMGNAIKNWTHLAKQCFEFTTPGGYTEFIDVDGTIYSPDSTIQPSSVSAKMNKEWLKASRAAGHEPSPGPLLEDYLQKAGFVNVKVQKFAVPIGPWPLDLHLKHIGNWNYLQLMQGMESLTYRLFTTVLGYSQAECDVVCAKMRQEMRDPQIHMMINLYVAYGRKPARTTTTKATK